MKATARLTWPPVKMSFTPLAYQVVEEEGTLPNTFYETSITLILKPQETYRLVFFTKLNLRNSLKIIKALAGPLSWLEHRLICQKVAGSIPSQGTFPGCRLNLQSEDAWEATN